MRKLSEKLHMAHANMAELRPRTNVVYYDGFLAGLMAAVGLAQMHEQLQGRRATETWRNPGWEEREQESKT